MPWPAAGHEAGEVNEQTPNQTHAMAGVPDFSTDVLAAPLMAKPKAVTCSGSSLQCGRSFHGQRASSY